MDKNVIFRIFFLIIFGAATVWGSVVLTDQQKIYDDLSLSYFYDESNALTPEAISQSRFTEHLPNPFTLGYREGAGWFRFTLHNRSSEETFVLTFSEPFWYTFNLFEPTSDGWIQHRAGLDTPLLERDIQDPFPAFELRLEPGESRTYLIRGTTYNAQLGDLRLYTHSAYFNPSRLTLNTFYIFYTGVLLILILLNLVLLAQMRERLNVYYIGYVLSFVIFISMFSGSYLMLGFEGWGTGLHTTGTAVMAFMALFSSEYLELKTYYPRLNRLFHIMVFVFIVMGVLIHYHTPYVTLIFNLISAALVFLLLVIAIRIWKAGHIQTRYYLAALILYMPTMGMMVLTFNTFLPNTDITRYAFLFGAMAELLFFSLILASKYHTAKFDEIRLQKELLAAKQKSHDYLQREIERQRHEIQTKDAMMFQQSRYAAMGEMIGNIAHQWRQPLNILSLILVNLKDHYETKELTHEKLESLTDKADELIQKMSTTIDDFRTFFEPNKEKKSFFLADAVQEAYNLVNIVFAQKNIEVSIDIDPSLSIVGYKNEFSQVLLNLLTNSRDAFESNHILMRRIRVYAYSCSDGICLEISDNAGGIPEEVLPRIFDPYFSTKEEGKGTGIGLYMSKTIIETHHHGSLTAANTEEGALFSIILPL